MHSKLLTLVLILSFFTSWGQDTIPHGNTLQMWENQAGIRNGQFLLGGYGEIHYNQAFSKDMRYTGNLDVHRLVTLMGYKFDNRISFFAEIEYEHVKELYVEQAYINYQLTKNINLTAGLLLIPMGYVNEFHEPNVFFGVERPVLDKSFVPTTWREIGLGINGQIPNAALNYQLYLVNGFLVYDGDALIGGKGYRSGRQKGAESIASTPNVAGKLTYYGWPRFKINVSVYSGNTASTLFDELDTNDAAAVAQADSSRLQLHMFGSNISYQYKRWKWRAQVNYAINGNTTAYNAFTGSDVGTSMLGYYIEGAFDVLPKLKNKYKLYPFARYSYVNTQQSVDHDDLLNTAYRKNIITTGLHFAPNDGVCIKGDFQFTKAANSEMWDKTFNLGVGVWFR